MYPRRHFFEQISGVLSNLSPERRASIPIFTDKHLAVTWDDADWIYRTGKELGLVHMAGSSVPQCFHRDPFFEHPVGSNIEDAVMISYGGIEACKHCPVSLSDLPRLVLHSTASFHCSDGYHGLEALIAMVERRKGGEAGITAVQCIEGIDAVWAAGEAGKFSLSLAEAAYQ